MFFLQPLNFLILIIWCNFQDHLKNHNPIKLWHHGIQTIIWQKNSSHCNSIIIKIPRSWKLERIQTKVESIIIHPISQMGHEVKNPKRVGLGIGQKGKRRIWRGRCKGRGRERNAAVPLIEHPYGVENYGNT